MKTSKNPASPLILKARSAALMAYAPYSSFRVGAALELFSGEVITGCNVENASYGLTICAERCALWSARAQFGDQLGLKIKALAVTCIDADPNLGENGLMPCGACRQVILELMPENSQIEVDGVGMFTPSELLPKGFKI